MTTPSVPVLLTKHHLLSQLQEKRASIGWLTQALAQGSAHAYYIVSQAERESAQERLEQLTAEVGVLQTHFDQGLYRDEVNSRGNIVLRDDAADTALNLPCGQSRYLYDNRLVPLGWQQFDTHEDAAYFGMWVNLQTRQTFCYAEGDRCLVNCPTVESFQAELDDAVRFYGPAPSAFTVIDTAAKTVTEVFTQRPCVAA